MRIWRVTLGPTEFLWDLGILYSSMVLFEIQKNTLSKKSEAPELHWSLMILRYCSATNMMTAEQSLPSKLVFSERIPISWDNSKKDNSPFSEN